MKNQSLKAVTEFYARKAEDYDRDYDTPYWKLYHEITWNNIKRFLPKTKNAVILDAGGGTGYWSIRLARQGYRMVLTDISQDMLKVAQRKIRRAKLQDRVKTRTADIRDMSCFQSNHFDMALAEGDPVSYCMNAQKAVKELARVIKENAPVIVSVDNKHTVTLKVLLPNVIEQKLTERSIRRLIKFSKTGIEKGDFKYQAFAPEELKTLFETCGLQVVRIIGKPVLAQSLPRESRDETISQNFRRMLSLESRFCDIPSLAGFGGHLEIVGVKSAGRSTPRTDSSRIP